MINTSKIGKHDLLFINQMQRAYREILRPRFWSTDRACLKNEGLVFHGTAWAIRLINSLLYVKNKYVNNIHREFSGNFPKNYFSRN